MKIAIVQFILFFWAISANAQSTEKRRFFQGYTIDSVALSYKEQPRDSTFRCHGFETRTCTYSLSSLQSGKDLLIGYETIKRDTVHSAQIIGFKAIIVGKNHNSQIEITGSSIPADWIASQELKPGFMLMLTDVKAFSDDKVIYLENLICNIE